MQSHRRPLRKNGRALIKCCKRVTSVLPAEGPENIMASQKSISDSEAGSQSIASDGSKQTKMKGFLEEAGMVKRPNEHVEYGSKEYYIKHVGFNNIEILEGSDGKGPCAYYVDVKAKFAGWDITIRKGGKDGDSVLQLRKAVTFARLLGWDKNTNVDLAHPEDEADTAGKAAKPKQKKLAAMTRKFWPNRKPVEGEPGKDDIIVPNLNDKELAELSDAEVAELPSRKVATITRKHAFRSNENQFEFDGRQYAWNYMVFLGSTLKLTDLETQDELAVCQLLPTWKLQMITSWSWRLNGTLEIKDEGIRRGMEDMIITTLTAMLEWRKHNNKVWIIAAAIA